MQEKKNKQKKELEQEGPEEQAIVCGAYQDGT